MRLRSVRIAVLSGLLGVGGSACSDDADTLVYVTVVGRAAVRPPARLDVQVGNDGMTDQKSFDVDSTSDLPQTFTITANGRSGALDVSVQAFDEDDFSVARGSARATLARGRRVDLTVQLEPDDFVVNQQVVGEQVLTAWNYIGRQVAVSPDDGSFVVTWEDMDCPLGLCHSFARLFGPDTLPRENQTTFTTDDFRVHQVSEWTVSPVIGFGAGGYLAVWLYRPDPEVQIEHVKASPLNQMGGHTASDVIVSAASHTDTAPVVIGRASNFVVAWQHQLAMGSPYEIRARLMGADGSPLVNPVTDDDGDFLVSATSGTDQTLPHGAAFPGNGFIIVWADRNLATDISNVHARPHYPSGEWVFPTDSILTSYSRGQVFAPHVATFASGTYVVVWQYKDGDERSIRFRRFDANHYSEGYETVVASGLSPGEAVEPGPAVAIRSVDDAVGIVWHDCAVDEGGEVAAQGCEIYLRVYHPDGYPSGPAVVVNTTRAVDQTTPSIADARDGFVIAWTDKSGEPPDTKPAGMPSGIRARVVYPLLDKRDGSEGAFCNGPDDAPCQEGLACSATDGGDRCLVACQGPQGERCAGGGVCKINAEGDADAGTGAIGVCDYS